MNTYRSAQVTIVPRHPKITPADDKKEVTNSQLPLLEGAWTTSSQSRMVQTGRNHERRPSSVVLSTSDDVKLLPKKPAKDPKIDSTGNKIKCPKPLLVVFFTIIALSSLGALAIGIYYIIRITTTPLTTTSTTTTTAFLLRWQAAATTLAGLGGPAGTAADRLSSPYHIALDSSNVLYVADYLNNRIQKFVPGSMMGTTVAGQASTAVGSNSYSLYYPAWVLVDSSGNLYVSDSMNHRVQYFPNGTTSGTTVAGTGTSGSGTSQLNVPRGLARDSTSGTLYVADSGNHRVVSYLSSVATVVAGGNGAGTLNTQLYTPAGLYFDSSSNSLYIANSGAHNIVRWVLGASTSILVAGSSVGSPGYTSVMLYSPMSVTLDPMGNVYVADYVNCRIQMFVGGQSNGTTIAGATLTAGTNPYLLYNPFAVILDSGLNLYVTDTTNQRIQKFLRY